VWRRRGEGGREGGGGGGAAETKGGGGGVRTDKAKPEAEEKEEEEEEEEVERGGKWASLNLFLTSFSSSSVGRPAACRSSFLTIPSFPFRAALCKAV
jgi:hypothetical protein